MGQSDLLPAYSQYYLDLDEGKGREIDVTGDKRWLVINGRTFYSINMSATLTVECKTSSRPWVFYNVPVSANTRLLRDALLICSKPDIFKTVGRYLGLVRMQKFLQEHHHHSKITELAVAFQEPFTNNQNRDPIFQSLLQTTKASEFHNSLAQERMSNQSVALTYPIVVFSGQLFSANLDDDNLTLAPSEHIVCQFAYRSSHYDRHYLVDVVTPDYLPLLMEQIRGSVDKLNGMIAEAPHAPKTVESFGLIPRSGVYRSGRIRKSEDAGVEVIVGIQSIKPASPSTKVNHN